MKKLQKLFAMLLAVCMVMSLLGATASATEEKTPYWQLTKEVDGVTQTITHAVLDSNGNLVNIGAEPGKLDATNLDPGKMVAQKFGAFEDEEDAANGIVKLTFDVKGKPIQVPGPLDVVIIADESGSLNMYGRSELNARLGENTKTGPQNIRTSASYMPCLNGAHAYLVGDLQKELYQIALARLTAAAGEINVDLKNAVSAALELEGEAQATELAKILAEETTAVTDAEAALLTAEAALAAAEAAHAPFASAIEEAAAAAVAAEAALEEAKSALTEEKAAVETAQAAVGEAQADVDEAQNAADVAQTAVNAAEAALDAALEESEIAAAQAVLDTAKDNLTAANTALEAAKADLVAANMTLTVAQSAYNEAYAANEMITAAETTRNEKKAALNEAEANAQVTAAAVANAETAADGAAAAVETAKAAFEAKKATVDALVKVKEMESKLAEEAVAADIYINPHDAGLEYTVFGQWGSAGNEPAVREMIKAGKLVDGTSANVEIPEILTDDDVYLALLSDWDEVALKSNGYLTFTTNYPVTKKDAETGEIVETGEVKAEKGKRMGWNPDTAHCHFEDGAYVLIEQPDNQNRFLEESNPYYNYDAPKASKYTTEQLTSYWSPTENVYTDDKVENSDNAEKYGCYDRMMIEKEAVISLTDQILGMDENNRVAYVGFSRGAYPSMSSLGLGKSGDGFCGTDDSDLGKMLTIMGTTDGHDYTNYCSPLWMLEKLLNGRADPKVPCYVVFISDGAPNKAYTFMNKNDFGWNPLAPVVEYSDGTYDEGDYIGYYKIFEDPSTNFTNSTAAAYVASLIEEKWGTPFYTVGFSTNEAASTLLASMASDEDSFFNCKTATDLLGKMTVVQQDIMTHYPSGVLTDVIGEEFDLIVNSNHPFTVDGSVYYSQESAEEDERVNFTAEDGETSVSSISWNLEQVDDKKGVQISFYVQLREMEKKHGELVNGKFRIDDTNADTKDAATGETVATGANLEYHKLIVDDGKSEGYYAEEAATNVPMKTPQVKIWKGEVIPETSPETPTYTPTYTPTDTPTEKPTVNIDEEDTPLASLPDEEPPLAELPEEDVPLAMAPATGDASVIWMALSALSGAGLFLTRKKREDEE